ncbi:MULTISPECIES: plasmid partitioning protein RepB [Rhizobium]|uniref:Plasmid partitioning protein RepB n=1 Tax=Rhizobium rhododendri TaxID=2506430 RepID=A0ABY8IRF0_9HYPH|nr:MULTISPECIES: plasmid partitioning protein RepB [Rhizobium]MBZ5763743.1 plasmid partitioning protein RepB [Rhizobium sp. VS19-DR96]MBZ5769676.1 plasmid partitioning protein RepB [Rhizobium sp. VS19-DR129.2]MBZ5777220.1 plasmid partitioning protein RepB [Rhizobium sp. VS19-DRK62.2]MBZ5788351.1 plasmid partitioning protein RepB [Rhizobium sp. VS19-DR121]MBZ5805798.1 plasmid partitioning protein RepB [Rhizobium sp. VS19-DR181]
MKKSILQKMADAESRGGSISSAETSEKSLPSRRHSSPVISNVGRALTQLSEDSIISLDPNKLERSPYKDRFDSDEEVEKELDALKMSIVTEGQKIPVLVRPHPTKSDHYQLAYGYRRWAAIKAIMAETERPESIRIKAYVRELTDRQLVEEQSLENGVRENLTWIEQAMWAVQLKSAGLSHRAICPILGLSEAAVSHLFRVTDVIPEDIVFAIGRAKGVGRPKWTTFADLLRDTSKVEPVRRFIETTAFQQAHSSERVALAIRAASGAPEKLSEASQEEMRDFAVGDRLFGRMKRTSSGTTVTIPKEEHAFARWLAQRMPDLLREYNHQDSSIH